jgi:tetratricopeptide (TPR) repeat protein
LSLIKKTVITLLFVLLPPALLLRAAPVADQEQFDFARYLFDGKEYYRAIGEFDRLLYFFPRTKLASEALFLTGLSYYRAGQFAESCRAFGALATNREFAFRAHVLSADALFRRGLYEESRAGYSLLQEGFPGHEPDLLLSMSWADLMRKDFTASVALYDAILEKYPSFDRKGDVEYLKNSVLNLKKFRKLSPALAASLSAVLPGAGQVYTRRPGDGLVAFGAVAFLGVGSYFLWKDYKHKEVAVLATLAAGFFYGGNIYSAWSSAKKYNTLYYRRNLDNLRDNYWSDHDR